MEYVDQSAKELRLSLLTGNVDMNQFSVLSAGIIQQPKLIIKAGIIGASHFLSIYKDDIVFHEIFACMEVKGGDKLLHYGPLDFVEGSADLALKGIHYSFEAYMHNWDEASNRMNDIETEIHNLNDFSKSVGLCFNFAGKDKNRIPKTLVLAKFHSGPSDGLNQLKIKTVHSYPNEDTIVLTEGLIIL